MIKTNNIFNPNKRQGRFYTTTYLGKEVLKYIE